MNIQVLKVTVDLKIAKLAHDIVKCATDFQTDGNWNRKRLTMVASRSSLQQQTNTTDQYQSPTSPFFLKLTLDL